MKLCHGYLFCYFQLYLWTPINLKTNLLSNTEKFSVECQKENLWWLWLTLYTLTSIWTFSILFSIHFLRCWLGEVVYQSRECLVCDHFLYFHDLCDAGVILLGEIWCWSLSAFLHSVIGPESLYYPLNQSDANLWNKCDLNARVFPRLKAFACFHC